MYAQLAASLFSRWNNAGLDTSIAKLYPAGDSPTTGKNRTGSPPGSSLPRAEYTLEVPPASGKSRGTRSYHAMAIVLAWGQPKETVDGYLDLIRNAYLNCEEAGTSPMTMTGGKILEVEDAGSSVMKEDDHVFMLRQAILIRFSTDNSVPA